MSFTVVANLRHCRPLPIPPPPTFLHPIPLHSSTRHAPTISRCPLHRPSHHPTPSVHLAACRLPATALLPRSQIPLLLTYARVAAIPLLCITTLTPSLSAHPILSASLFALASLTDFLDGYLARLWRVESPLGVFLDPVADKLLVAVALVILVARFQLPALSLAAAVILAREIFVSALRERMALLHLSLVVKVSFWGKLKTATQMLALTLLLLVRDPASQLAAVGVALAVVSATLAVFSAAEYVVAALRAYDKGAPV